jgi:hypothetical protein
MRNVSDKFVVKIRTQITSPTTTTPPKTTVYFIIKKNKVEPDRPPMTI